MKFLKRSSSVSPLHGWALITGGTSGIGLAYARALARRGCDIVLVARGKERLAKIAAQLRETYGVQVEELPADLSTDDGVKAVCERLAGDINVLVNNAGKGLHHKLATTDTAPLEEAIDLMATSVVKIGGAAGASMKKRGRGVIINTASVSGLVPMGLYSAIKSLVITWSDALSIELKPAGVQVVTFMPGWVRTEHHKRAGISTSNLPDWIWLNADEIAEETLRAIDRGKTRVTPSLKFKVISALAQHAPKGAVHAVTAKISRGRDE